MKILQDGAALAEVKKASVRALLILYSVAVIYGLEGATITAELHEHSGLQTIFALMREAVDGRIRSESDHQIEWQLIALLIKLLYVLCFNKQTQNRMMQEENITVLFQVLQQAIDNKR